MNLSKKYNREDFLKFIKEDFLPSFSEEYRKITEKRKFEKVFYLGKCEEIDTIVIEIEHSGSMDKKVTMTQDAFKIIQDYGAYRALVVFYCKSLEVWRFSLITMTPAIKEEGRIELKKSNPRRHSFILGPSAKINTPTKYLLDKGKVVNFEELKNRFSVEVVNKDFYQQIAILYTKLIGGERGLGIKKKVYPGLLKLPSTAQYSEKMQRFAVRLIGRIVFCWFLREKKSEKGTPLISSKLLSFEAVQKKSDYYHSILEPIFFETLNRPTENRKDRFQEGPFNKIPYLNGGLFSPDNEDYYSYNEGEQAVNNNIVKVPDSWLSELFEVLELYNFTVDENTSIDVDLSIDPEMLGRIFENLLAEINPETGESARNKTGSFYTPREIVDYMVDQSLIEYLSIKTEIGREKLEFLVLYSGIESFKFSEIEQNQIIQALSNFKAIDPACGSGAFPMGLLQKIVHILQVIDPDAKLWFKEKIKNITDHAIKRSIEERFESESLDYIRKLGVIRDSIFGVDIQPIATEISRLRCFLTLIVEESVDDDKVNRGIEALPNLDFKFVTANSLIPLIDNSDKKEQTLFEDREGIEELKELRHKYFNATNSERVYMQEDFKKKQEDMLQRMIELKYNAGTTSSLSTWNPFDEKPTPWFDSEWMFGVEKFSLSIGNPPYIQLQKNNGELGNLYKDLGFETFTKTGDIYVLFYEKGLKLTEEETGLLCYITSNKWLRAGYGEKLREYFSKKNPIQLIDFGGFKVFESATVDTNILLIQNNSREDSFNACHFKNDYQKGESIRDYFNENKNVFKDPTSKSWFVGSLEETALKQKIEKSGKPLKEWDVEFFRGIQTGNNEVFVINAKIYAEIIKKSPEASKHIYPVLRGRDIDRFSNRYKNLWLLYTDRNTDVDNLSGIKEYLYSNKKILLNKREVKEGKIPWYSLYRPASAHFNKYFSNKIVWGDDPQYSKFTITNASYCILGPAYFMIGEKLEYLLGILNSKVVFYFLSSIAPSLGEKAISLKLKFLEKTPIPRITMENSCAVDEIKKLVNQILILKNQNQDADTKNLEEQIDQLVYNLYQLTEDEIKIIENQS
jgi:adenine-specific DNA-methyltransferase